MTIYYADFSAPNNGNGLAMNQASGSGLSGAFNTIVGLPLVAGDTVWVRRTSLSVSTTIVFSNQVILLGWPISTDSYYASRPTNTTWDSDSQQYAIITQTSINNVVNIQGNNSAFNRIKFTNSFANGTIITFINALGNAIIGTKFSNCIFENQLIAGNNQFSNVPTYGIYYNCQFNFLSTSTANGLSILNNNCKIINCSMTYTGAYSGSYSIATNVNRCTIINLTITFLSITSNTGVFTIGGSKNIIKGLIFNYGNSVAPSPTLTVSGNYNYVSGYSVTYGSGITISGVANQLIFDAVSTPSSTISGTFISFTNVAVSNNVRIKVLTVPNNNILNVINVAGTNNVLLINTAYLNSGNGVEGVVISNSTNYVVSLNHMGIANNFRTFSYQGESFTTSVSRTGGSSYGLKCFTYGIPVAYSEENNIGVRDYPAYYITLTGAATHTITFYGYYKGYNTPPDQGEIYFDGEYVYSDTVNSVTSYAPGFALGTDTSIWASDGTVTPFSIVITIVTLGTINLELWGFITRPEQNSYVVFDPVPVVT